MKPRTVTVTLTQLEAEMLSFVAGNGWGDGDFADYIGNKRKAEACARAMEKLVSAINTTSRDERGT